MFDSDDGDRAILSAVGARNSDTDRTATSRSVDGNGYSFEAARQISDADIVAQNNDLDNTGSLSEDNPTIMDGNLGWIGTDTSEKGGTADENGRCRSSANMVS